MQGAGTRTPWLSSKAQPSLGVEGIQPHAEKTGTAIRGQNTLSENGLHGANGSVEAFAGLPIVPRSAGARVLGPGRGGKGAPELWSLLLHWASREQNGHFLLETDGFPTSKPPTGLPPACLPGPESL